MNFLKYTLIFILGLLIQTQSFSQCSGNNTIFSNVDQVWSNANNWTQNCVPTSPITGQITIADNIVYSGSVNYVIDGRFQIDKNRSIINAGTGSFTVNGELTGEGIFSGNLILNGDIKPGDVAPDCENTVTSYGGEFYESVPIGSQCWMDRNLNIGNQINIVINGQTNNGVIEKYCYDNNPVLCDIFGGHYEWNEVMNHNFSGDICPNGWHVPSDAEFQSLEIGLGMAASSANSTGYRGTNQGSQIAGGPSWQPGALRNHPAFGTSGFTAVPAGISVGGSQESSTDAYIWTSSATASTTAYFRQINSDQTGVRRDPVNKLFAMSVRCVQD